jgi:hypothetical protein
MMPVEVEKRHRSSLLRKRIIQHNGLSNMHRLTCLHWCTYSSTSQTKSWPKYQHETPGRTFPRRTELRRQGRKQDKPEPAPVPKTKVTFYSEQGITDADGGSIYTWTAFWNTDEKEVTLERVGAFILSRATIKMVAVANGPIDPEQLEELDSESPGSDPTKRYQAQIVLREQALQNETIVRTRTIDFLELVRIAVALTPEELKVVLERPLTGPADVEQQG